MVWLFFLKLLVKIKIKYNIFSVLLFNLCYVFVNQVVKQSDILCCFNVTKNIEIRGRGVPIFKKKVLLCWSLSVNVTVKSSRDFNARWHGTARQSRIIQLSRERHKPGWEIFNFAYFDGPTKGKLNSGNVPQWQVVDLWNGLDSNLEPLWWQKQKQPLCQLCRNYR